MPVPLAAQVHAALDSSLRDRAPAERPAFWKAVALGYGGNCESPAGCPTQLPSLTSP
ncbi:hypothetical protein [Methylobacterium sp. W2]|uniref:hypothetical protein n=1 Tax=Methylobacterium sp. W2 TaxID=2598107 RepID=UPI001D0CB4BD|nr:hypothetical protein [Methylobacterium sp. W2]